MVDPAGAGAGPLRLGVIAPTSTVARLAVMPAAVRSGLVTLQAVASRLGAPALPVPGGVDGAPEPRRHAGYEALLADPEVEAVYLPLPNSLHREWTEAAAAAGKHVLCEKPLAPCEADARAMGAACERAGVVLMEAYMTPFHPRAEAVERLVAEGALGRLLFARAAFTGTLDRPEDHRWRPEMGGGVLLDIGIYCLAPVLAAAGLEASDVARVAAVARRAPLGVDASFSAWLDLGDGAAASIECSFEAPERQLLELVGTEGAIFLDRAYTPGPADTVIQMSRRGAAGEAVTTPGGDPYQLMLEHFARVVRGTEPLRRPPAVSADLAGLLDRLAAAAAIS